MSENRKAREFWIEPIQTKLTEAEEMLWKLESVLQDIAEDRPSADTTAYALAVRAVANIALTDLKAWNEKRGGVQTNERISKEQLIELIEKELRPHPYCGLKPSIAIRIIEQLLEAESELEPLRAENGRLKSQVELLQKCADLYDVRTAERNDAREKLDKFREAAAVMRDALIRINTRVEHDRQLYQTDLEAIREYSEKALTKSNAAMKV